MAEIWGAALVVTAGTLAAGAMQADAAKSAGNAISQGADAAAAESRRQFDLTRADTAPYRQIGINALGTLGNVYGYSPPQTSGAPPTPGVDASSGYQIGPNGSISQTLTNTPGAPGSTPGAGTPNYAGFFASPDYQFRKDQGMQGIERSFAAKGMGKSGNALATLADYNSNLASGEFGNWFNRTASLAGIGQSAVNTSTAAGVNLTGQIGNAMQNSAAGRASGITGSANAWGNAINDAAYGAGQGWYNYNNPKNPPGSNTGNVPMTNGYYNNPY